MIEVVELAKLNIEGRSFMMEWILEFRNICNLLRFIVRVPVEKKTLTECYLCIEDILIMFLHEEDLLFVWFMVIDSFCNISVMNYTNMLEYLYIYKIEQTHFWQPYGYA